MKNQKERELIMSPNITNILITGEKKCGKSYLLDWVVRELSLTICGFKTKPYYIKEKQKGFYLHSILPVRDVENDLPISVQHQKNSCISIGETFATLGVSCLMESIMQKADCIVMDELGRLERDERRFHHAVYRVLDSNQLVLAVIKKESVPWLDVIRSREDSVVLDLDLVNQRVAYDKIVTLVAEYQKQISYE